MLEQRKHMSYAAEQFRLATVEHERQKAAKPESIHIAFTWVCPCNNAERLQGVIVIDREEFKRAADRRAFLTREVARTVSLMLDEIETHLND